MTDLTDSQQNIYGKSLVIGVAAGNVTIAQSDYLKFSHIFITGAGVAGRVVTVPTVAGLKNYTTDRNNAYPVTVKRGTTEVVIDPATVKTLETDGLANGLSDETGSPANAGFSDDAPLPAAGDGDPGDSPFAARADHVHPAGAVAGWSTEDADFNAVAGGQYVPNCTDAAITATLDPDPEEGDTVLFADDFKSWGAHPLTIARSGHTIMGDASNMTASSSTAAGLPNLAFGLRFTNNDWRILL